MATFGIGLLARTLFQQLSKLGGVPGWLLSSAIAASTTVAIGYASSVWFEKGERISQKTFNDLTKNLTQVILENLKNRFKRKPDNKSFKQALEETLEESGMADLENIEQAAKGESK